MLKQDLKRRYFTSYTGVELPLKLVNELDDASLDNRITYFVGYFDDKNRLMVIEKVVYGEIEFSHHYEYNDQDVITQATLVEEDEPPRTMMLGAG